MTSTQNVEEFPQILSYKERHSVDVYAFARLRDTPGIGRCPVKGALRKSGIPEVTLNIRTGPWELDQSNTVL
jgi:hypothetical protein